MDLRIAQRKGLSFLFLFLVSIKLSAQVDCSFPDTTCFSQIQPAQYTSGFTPKKLVLPLSLIGVGALGTAIDNLNDFHLFSRKESVKQIRVDDYLEWGMLGWVFVCDLVGEEKHSWKDQLFLVVLAEGMNAGMVRGLKHVIDERRPDGGPHSFPSGHTANSFLGAHLAYKEFKDTNPWLAYSGYGIATFVGISRLYNNRHWVADVLAGAGFGILSLELAYLIYFPVRNKIMNKFGNNLSEKLIISPSFNQYGGGVHMVYCF